MSKLNLTELAHALLGGSRGLLAADDPARTLGKRFQKIALENTEANRRAFRELLVTTPGASDHLSGVSFCEELLNAKTSSNERFIDVLAREGVLTGVRVDRGSRPLPFAPGEGVTEGLDGLRERLDNHAKLGVRFAKWHAVIELAPGLPSELCLRVNAAGLAQHAALCQEAGILPIVAPEILMAGDHGLDRCYDITRRMFGCLFEALFEHRVALEGLLLAPTMVLPGRKANDQSSVEDIADATVRLLKHAVPAAVPGVVFISGGQGETAATVHLNAMNVRHKNLPWKLSFAYGDALEQAALTAWSGKAAQVVAAQEAFAERAKLNAAAAAGAYSPTMEP